jgi:hypothetical protein
MMRQFWTGRVGRVAGGRLASRGNKEQAGRRVRQRRKLPEDNGVDIERPGNRKDEWYRACLAELGQLAVQDPDPASPEGARLEFLAKLVEDYEQIRFPFRKPDPGDLMVFRMEQQR